MFPWNEHKRSGSFSSDDSHPGDHHHGHHRNHSSSSPIPPPVLVYHESARSIVFRDHLRRANSKGSPESNGNNNNHHVIKYDTQLSNESVDVNGEIRISNYTPIITPLAPLELSAQDTFQPLLDDNHDTSSLTSSERHVLNLMETQHACVKTLKHSDWSSFFQRFSKPLVHARSNYPDIHDDKMSGTINSFVTSTTLLPPMGQKMRTYGSVKEYTTGVVFELPQNENEDQAVQDTQTWAWPSGYAAKTEYNIDSHGRLINGRKEALVSLNQLRENNTEYITKKDYKIMGRLVQGGLHTVPYNEVFLRVGGSSETGKSLHNGVGLPVALFVRSASYGHLITLLRTRARAIHHFGAAAMQDVPLLLLTPESGARILTKAMQDDLLKIAAQQLNPFQNTAIAYKTTLANTQEAEMSQKMEELLDLDSTKRILTDEERARLAGGFGATDESTAKLLMEAKKKDQNGSGAQPRHHLQDIVNEGLAAAVRSGDYHTARQLLILYTLVASSKGDDDKDDEEDAQYTNGHANEIDKDVDVHVVVKSNNQNGTTSTTKWCDTVVKCDSDGKLQPHSIPPPPPPPPLDTERLRSATNSDGLLAVLGAAQVLKAMQDGSAQQRVLESIRAIDEWVEHGQNSVAFRLASWRDQHVAQADLKIAMEHDSSFMAFVSNKAIVNRKAFAGKLKQAVEATNFQSIDFLRAIHETVSKMHSPCLRLELLQFILGLDNRFSVAHLARSVELAATCLSISSSETVVTANDNASVKRIGAAHV